MGNTVAVLMRKAPYGSVYTAEGFRSIMGIGVFEMDINVLFADDGVYALTKGQNPAGLDMKPLGEAFPMLPDFGVTKFYVHDQSLSERGLTPDDLVMDVEIVDDAGAARVLESSGIVLPF
ncbi:MAG: sulfurtransferase complex subunit TusC [Chloroflexi bacterium]|jgi:tRNA 2-thiouridine synthesizing protein C|nr:sulfurtransferase complex subunit TusC [Chloroflexota bacterium]